MSDGFRKRLPWTELFFLILIMKTKVKFVLSTLVAAAAMNSVAFATDYYVSSDYSSSTSGWGKTHFATYEAALGYHNGLKWYDKSKYLRSTIVIEKTSSISGNCVNEDVHEGFANVGVLVKDGATFGVATNKWDMTYAVTVKAGGSLVTARPKTSTVGYTHLKNALTIGERNSTQKAYLHFLSDSYQDGDISIRYNGSLTAYNADIAVQDLDAQGEMTLEDCTVKVDGALATDTFYGTTLTRVQMTVGGTQISGGLSDFSGGATNLLGNFSMTDSTLTFGEGAAVKVAGNVTLENSSIYAGTIEVAADKKISISGDCELAAIVTGSGSIVVSQGATLTVASSSLLDGIKVEQGSGNIVYNTVDSTVTTNEITLKNADGKAVELSAGAGTITVNSASEITDASEISVIEAVSGGVVLVAWSFDIDNGEGGDKTGVTVTMDVGEGQALESLRIFHEENGVWTDVTSVVTDKELKDGKLSFTTKDFSGYAVATPEPSMFGLMAGLGALVLVGTRRRRQKA